VVNRSFGWNELIFIIDLPFFAVSLALTKGNKPQVGVVYNPVTCELFYAIKGRGAYLVRMIGDKEVRIKLKVTRKKESF